MADDAVNSTPPWLGDAEFRQLWQAIPEAVVLSDQAGVIRYANPAAEALFGHQGGLAGESLALLQAPAAFAEFAATLARYLRTGTRALEWSATRSIARHSSGREFPIELSFDEVQIGAGRIFATVVRDISARDAIERRQAALQKISEAAHSADDLESLFPRIHEVISSLLPARNFYVALYDADSDLISFPYYIDEFDAPPEPRRLADGLGLTEFVLQTCEPLLLAPDNIGAHLLLHGAILVGTEGLDWLGIPLKTARGCIGVLAVQSYSGSNRYTEQDKELLQFVSDQVAAAVERTRDQQALRLSEGRFHSVFEESPIINCLLSFPEGKFLEMNQAGLRAFGYARDEVVGKTSVEMGAWVDEGDRNRYLALLRETGSVRNFETRMRRRDGEQFTVLYSGSIVTLGGQVLSLNSLQDISERKRAESALQESEQQFKSAFENSAIGMSLVGLDGRFLQVNPALCVIMGLDEPGLLSKTFQEITHPDDLDANLRRLDELIHGSADNCRMEKRYVRGDGRIVPALLAVSLVRDSLGAPRHFITQVEDITERKRAEQWQQHYSDTLAMLMAEAPNRTVLESLARFVESQGEGLVCSIHTLSDDGARLVHGAAPSLPDWYNDAIDGQPIGLDIGSCGSAAATGMLQITEDIANAPAWRDFSGLAAKAGLRSCWSQPVLSSDGRVVGTFAIYRSIPSTPSLLDLELIRASAGLAAIAIERARHHDERRLAKVVFEQNVEGIMVTDPEGRVLMVNRSFEELTGYSSMEVVGQSATIFDPTRHDPAIDLQQREALRMHGRWQGEVWGRKNSGEAYPMALSLANVTDVDGKLTQRINILADVSDQKIQAARIEQLAFYDALTGLPNRALFLDRLEQTLSASARHGGQGAIMFLDLDRFKEINDSQGHAVGDMALVEVARRFQMVSRKEETLARLGGDEFVLIAENADHQAAVRIAGRLQRALAEPLQLAGHSYQIGASIGIAFYPADGTTSGDLIKHTDIAMYRAKAGGGGYRLYQSEMGAELEKRLIMAKRLAIAMESGLLALYYQPQINLETGSLIGAEALLRWQDPVLGWVSPADFIPVAEERGMMGALGDWVLREACRQVCDWDRGGLRMNGRVAINVSALQLGDPDIVGRMLGIVHSAGLSPERFELELTEGSMMADPERAVEVLELLSAAGFGLSIDDFGTGYSSLSYLKRFASDQIKIDISFVRNMLTDSDDHTIVTTIIAMARALGMQTTAEGVEEHEQAQALLALGCDRAQGYHFGRPVAADAFRDSWLAPTAAG